MHITYMDIITVCHVWYYFPTDAFFMYHLWASTFLNIYFLYFRTADWLYIVSIAVETLVYNNYGKNIWLSFALSSIHSLWPQCICWVGYSVLRCNTGNYDIGIKFRLIRVRFWQLISHILKQLPVIQSIF